MDGPSHANVSVWVARLLEKFNSGRKSPRIFYRLLYRGIFTLQVTAALLAGCFSVSSSALDIPFLASNSLNFYFQFVDGENQQLSSSKLQSLEEKLEAELNRQRESNLTLQQYRDPLKIAQFEARLLSSMLRSLGYLDNQVRADLTQRTKAERNLMSDLMNTVNGSEGQSEEKVITFFVNPGRLYRIALVDISLPPGFEKVKDLSLPLVPGRPLEARQVFAAQDALETYLQENYCLLSPDVSYEVLVTPEEATAEVYFRLDDSREFVFGAVRIEGLESIDPAFFTKHIKIAEGACFKRNLVEGTRLALLRTNLLATAEAKYQVGETSVDITLDLRERHHRTVEAGVGYSTDEGKNVSAGWEHRNIFGSGEKLDVDFRVSEKSGSLAAELTIPSVIRDDIALQIEGELSHVNYEFQANKAEAGAALSHQFNPELTFSVGSDVTYSDAKGSIESYLVSFPVSAVWDTADDLFDPKEGWTLSLEWRPYVDFVNPDTRFFKTTFTASTYYSFDGWLTPTLALRGALGTIRGETLDGVPKTERFYSGGGGSVRGYPFQTLSAFDAEEDEYIGGRSFQELSLELRTRINDDWGIVIFSDAGYAFEEPHLGSDENFLWSVGLGIRYFTLIAPLRVDFAIPLDRRQDDDSFQLYINLGQAF